MSEHKLYCPRCHSATRPCATEPDCVHCLDEAACQWCGHVSEALKGDKKMAFYVDPSTYTVHTFRPHSPAEIVLDDGRVLTDSGEVPGLCFASVESAAAFSTCLAILGFVDEAKEWHTHWLEKLLEGQQKARKA